MEPKARDYTEWQIARIRLALSKYRILHARNGFRPSWEDVRDAIIFSQANIARYRANPDNTFHSERLRRFAAGGQRLEPDKVGDTARFLLQAGVLKADELDESKSDLGQFLHVRQFLGNETELAQERVGMFAGHYAAHRQLSTQEVKSLLLALIPDPSKTFLRVEEVVRIRVLKAVSPRYRKNDEVRRNTRRVGYAFPVTPRNVMHIYLGGFSADQRITYVQADTYNGAAGGAGLFLLRSGEEIGPDESAGLPADDGLAALPNIYRFSRSAEYGA